MKVAAGLRSIAIALRPSINATRAVPPEKLDEVTNEALEAIAAKAPLAIKMGRKAFAETADRNLEDSLDYLCNQLGAVVATEDAKEGLTAFLQKRQPQWKGR